MELSCNDLSEQLVGDYYEAALRGLYEYYGAKMTTNYVDEIVEELDIEMLYERQ